MRIYIYISLIYMKNPDPHDLHDVEDAAATLSKLIIVHEKNAEKRHHRDLKYRDRFY